MPKANSTSQQLAERTPGGNLIVIGSASYPTIKDAMDAIGAVDGLPAASADNIYTLDLAPNYQRAPLLSDTFAWKSYVRVRADYLYHKTTTILDAENDIAAWPSDKLFFGIDFSGLEDVNWQPFIGAMPGMVIGSTAGGSAGSVYDNTADMLFSSSVTGDVVIVEDTGSGDVGLYVLVGEDPSEIGDWALVTPQLVGVVSGINFNGLQAVGFTLQAAHASFLQMKGCFMPYADFRYSKLDTFANFSGSELRWSTFQFANLADALFEGCNLVKATFRDCVMTAAYMANSDCTSASFRDANLAGADFQYSNLSGADLRDATFTTVNLMGVNLNGANCNGTDFTGATMPLNANTKATFKTIVGAGNYNAVTTIWTDGTAVGA